MLAIRAEIRGLDEQVRRLADLKESLARRILRAGLRKAASIVNKAAKANLENGPLKKSLGVKIEVNGSKVQATVEPRGGFKTLVRRTGKGKPIYTDPRRIAHLKERGTKSRQTKKGFNRGAQPAEPFLYPALAANESKVQAVIEEEIDKGLAKAANR